MKNFWKAAEFDLNDDNVRGEHVKDITEEVKKVFEQWGVVKSVFVKFDTEKKTPYAFISYADHDTARKVVDKFNHRQ